MTDRRLEWRLADRCGRNGGDIRRFAFFILRHVSAVITISYLWVRLRGLLPRAEKMVFVLAWRRCFITFAVYGRLAL